MNSRIPVLTSSAAPVTVGKSPKASTLETPLIVAFASILVLANSWPAFKYYFFGEAFTYLRIYELHDRHLWEAAFSLMDGMFFRPVIFLSDVWWHSLLPADPVVYHLRNFLFVAINLSLLYRILLRLVATRGARVIAIGLVAGSKIYLTVIGYLNTNEASVLLLTILLTVLFWLRYIVSRRTADYLLSIFFCLLSVYSRDYGVAIIGVLAAMIPAAAILRGQGKSQMKFWLVRGVPFIVVGALYLASRYWLTGPIAADNQVYSPKLSLSMAFKQSAGLVATAGNFSLLSPTLLGARGIVKLLARDSAAIELALCTALWILILCTLWRCRDRWRALIFPIVWVGVYLFPTFLIRNQQVYYYQEPIVGIALMLGICLDRLNRRWLISWSVVVALIALNGFISSRQSHYAWQEFADRAEEIVPPIVAEHKSNPPESIVFVTSPQSRGFWTFAIGGPLIPHLLGSSKTTVVFADSEVRDLKPGVPVYRLPDYIN